MKKWIKYSIIFFVWPWSISVVSSFILFLYWHHSFVEKTNLGNKYIFHNEGLLVEKLDGHIHIGDDIDSLFCDNIKEITQLHDIVEVRNNENYILAKQRTCRYNHKYGDSTLKVIPETNRDTTIFWVIDKRKDTIHGPYNTNESDNVVNKFKGIVSKSTLYKYETES